MKISQPNKLRLGGAFLMLAVGFFKLFVKGVRNPDGSIDWFDVLFPGALGIMLLFYVFIKISQDQN